MSLFAKGHKRNPMTAQEKADTAKADTRSWIERINDEKREHGISEMSDEELNALYESLTSADSLMQPVAHEVRIRRNAKQNLTPQESWVEGVKRNPGILH